MKECQFAKMRLVAGLLVISLLLSLIPFVELSAQPPTDLFFSEYIEGSGFNKALEIYNGTGSAVNLAGGDYSILISFNGGSSTYVIDLTGTVADGDVFVVAPTNATDETIIDEADQFQGTGWFNGDDAILLRKGATATVIDAIGQLGFDPGSQWGSGDASTQDNTLRRKADICTGDTDETDAFDPALEWDGFANNTFDGLGSHTVNCGTLVQEPKINEFVANHTGTDTNEYLEVFGDPDTDYSTLTLLEIEGDGSGAGILDGVWPVGTTDAGGFWFTGYLSNEIENGTITLLLVSDFTGTPGSDLDTDNDGILDLAPWSAVADSVAVTDGGSSDRTYSGTVLAEYFDGMPFTPGGASRIPDGAANWVRNDFDGAGIPGFAGSPAAGEAYNTPGAQNEIYVPPPEACGDDFTAIYTIQGSGPASGLDGSEVATEGVVIGDFQVGGKGGFFIQDEVGDLDKATSDGIFVYSTSLDVNVGDKVRVRGTVDEYFGLTEITNVSQVWWCADGFSVAPATLSLPVDSLDEFEPYEGMLVTFPQPLYISEYFNFDRYGEIVLTSDRQFQPTAVYEPGSPEAAQLALDNSLGRITLDDGRTWQNPDPAIHPNGAEFTLTNLFRGGDTVANVTGALDYYFDLYRIQPTQGADYVAANPRTAQPEDVGGNLTVASFNVLNYFTTIDTGAEICGPDENQECRGADTVDEFERQRAKIIAALVQIDADVVGLIEIENHPGDVPTADLVSGLNDVLGAGTYDYVATGAIGTDAIRQAIIYKPATASPVGGYAVLDDASFTDPLGYGEEKSRPALAQTFMDEDTGGIFTAVVNHLKSKGSSCGEGDDDPEAGSCNLTRALGAQALVDWLAGDPTDSGDSDFLIIGDLNSYDKEEPIDALVAGGYTDLLANFLGEYAYSYVFDGQLGYLDYGMASQDLLPEVTGVTAWHINADEPDLIDYDMSFKQPAQDDLYAPDAYRASDHDPVIAGLAVCDEIAPTAEVSLTPDTLWPVNHKYVQVVATVEASDNLDPNPTVSLVLVTSSDPEDGLGDGNTTADIEVVDDFTFNLRAERSGQGENRIYTITYEVTDACGNSTLASATVTVPHDQRQDK